MGEPVPAGAPVTVERRLSWLDEDEAAASHRDGYPDTAGYRRERDTISFGRDRGAAADPVPDPPVEDPPTGRPYSDQPFQEAERPPLTVDPPIPVPAAAPPHRPGPPRVAGFGAARFGEEESGPPASIPPPRRPVMGPSSEPRRRVRGWVIALILIVVIALAVATVLLAVLDAGNKEQTGPGQPVAGQAGSDHTISAPMGDRREADFDLVTGTSAVTVRSADLGGDLYRISTPENGGSVPKVVNQGSTVKLFLSSTGQVGPAAVDIQLNTLVLWRLRLTGGASELTVNLTNGRVGNVDLAGGATRIELTLPAPAGTVPIRMTGGANQFLVHAPTNAPVRVHIGSGASKVTVDGVAHTGIAPGAVFTPNNWDQTQDRYDIDASAGVATLTVDRG
jgi:hypothetical protein